MAERASYLFELAPQDCNTVGVVQSVISEPCQWASMIITGAPGSTIWFWVGPTTFESPDGSDVYEFDYWLHVGPWGLAAENHTLSNVRSLFR